MANWTALRPGARSWPPDLRRLSLLLPFVVEFPAMDDKSLSTLEYRKVLEKLAAYADFSASAELARALRPTDKLDEAVERQTRTSEARRLLSIRSETTIGGALDIRPQIEIAARSGVLTGEDLLNIKGTLIAARELARALERQAEHFPRLAEIAARMPPPPGLIETITRAISDRGEVLDSASPKLASIRSEMRVAHERLLGRLERLINDPQKRTHPAGANHHAAQRALRHPAARRFQGPHPLDRPRPILLRADAVRGAAGGGGAE